MTFAPITSMADELATVRSQLWPSSTWQADWNALITTVPTDPSVGEVATWNSYVPAGLAIDFSANGEVS